MASLRDQLVAKGLASKKDQQRVERERREEERKSAAAKPRRAAEEARIAAERAAIDQAALDERVRARKALDQLREAAERGLRIRNLVIGNRLGCRGDVPFFHRGLDGGRLNRLLVSDAMAWRLRAGQVGIVGWRPPEGEVVYTIVTRHAIERLETFAPEVVVSFVRDTSGISHPAEQFNTPKQGADLRAHRVRPACDG